jgi:hypothetical protein
MANALHLGAIAGRHADPAGRSRAVADGGVNMSTMEKLSCGYYTNPAFREAWKFGFDHASEPLRDVKLQWFQQRPKFSEPKPPRLTLSTKGGGSIKRDFDLLGAVESGHYAAKWKS